MSEPGIACAPFGKNRKLFGMISLILGMLAIASPLITGLAVAILVGVLVLIGGLTRLTWAFHAKTIGRTLLGFAVGGLTVLCGLALVTDPVFASGFLTILLATYFVINGVLEIAAAFHARPLPGWGWLLVAGMFSLLLGGMIWRQFPLSGSWAIGVLLGLQLLFAGLIMVSMPPVARQKG